MVFATSTAFSKYSEGRMNEVWATPTPSSQGRPDITIPITFALTDSIGAPENPTSVGRSASIQGTVSRLCIKSDDLDVNLKDPPEDYTWIEVDLSIGAGFFGAPVLFVNAKVIEMVTSGLPQEEGVGVAQTALILPSLYLEMAVEVAKTIPPSGRPKYLTCQDLMS
ncbi:hypothetical protein RHGRI_007187 [Rhododendron griersonianum]|uniref:Uncharacterized protein n=1 Tax=Rhododendron griersonianum TaxID=479676 RepID=A0AAV6KW59_9ERIC|nr:hypothetical protein RHGRI_007187 [Rhododendron griersonianum]